jgi:hypothetical protein
VKRGRSSNCHPARMLYEPKRWKQSVIDKYLGCWRLGSTIVDDYGGGGTAVAVCALLDSMVALVRRLADVVGLRWSRRRRVATTRRLGLDIIDAIDHPALMSVACYGDD